MLPFKTIRKNKILYLIYRTEGEAKEYSRRLLTEAAGLFAKEAGEDPRVLFTETGKPYFPRSPYFLSVTHSGPFLVFAFAPFPIGIDLEPEGVEKERIRERYFTEEEKRLPFSRVWTGKEAVGKLTGMGLTDALRTCVSDTFATLDGKKYSLFYHSVNGYLLTVAMEEENEKRP